MRVHTLRGQFSIDPESEAPEFVAANSHSMQRAKAGYASAHREGKPDHELRE
jgi:hypothetical protein